MAIRAMRHAASGNHLFHKNKLFQFDGVLVLNETCTVCSTALQSRQQCSENKQSHKTVSASNAKWLRTRTGIAKRIKEWAYACSNQQAESNPLYKAPWTCPSALTAPPSNLERSPAMAIQSITNMGSDHSHASQHVLECILNAIRSVKTWRAVVEKAAKVAFIGGSGIIGVRRRSRRPTTNGGFWRRIHPFNASFNVVSTQFG